MPRKLYTVVAENGKHIFTTTKPDPSDLVAAVRRYFPEVEVARFTTSGRFLDCDGNCIAELMIEDVPD